ncbi:uncharacterized protein LOC134229527 [Saccostrea cucullata]|uniref:uncharacterized protein LOC134229527 n=1 Tax=Saccostrea cuccullata TaxID=36930 RepID=UPI002ECFC9B9
MKSYWLIVWFVFLLTPALSSGETQNSRLTGYVITSLSPIGFRGCSKECNSYSDCKSFNFNRVHLFCELSYKSRGESESNLVEDKGFVYVEKTEQQENSSACKGSGRRCISLHNNDRSKPSIKVNDNHNQTSIVSNCVNMEKRNASSGLNSTLVGSTIVLQEEDGNENDFSNYSILM